MKLYSARARHFLQMDAPHTGARLETQKGQVCAQHHRMPPTRGHDLKHRNAIAHLAIHTKMPPTRGHDLKHFCLVEIYIWGEMPPTRGHDLKQHG